MSTKVAISGYYGFKNFGDELILSVLIKYLKSRKCDITVFSVNPKFTINTYNVNSEKTFNLFAVLKTLLNADVLISGGGSLFQDSTSINSLFYYAFVLGVAQILRKKTIIFAQGIGPLNSPISRFIVKTLFKRVNFISVRDEKSLELLNNWGIKSQLVDDPAFNVQIPSGVKNNAIGIQLRGRCNINSKFLPHLARAVAQSEFKQIKIIPLQMSVDNEISKKFAQLLKDFAPEKQIEFTGENLIDEISTLDTLVSMRYHALVVGIKSDVKCIGINYDPKITALCEEFNLPITEFNDNSNVIREKIKQAKSAFTNSKLKNINLDEILHI